MVSGNAQAGNFAVETGAHAHDIAQPDSSFRSDTDDPHEVIERLIATVMRHEADLAHVEVAVHALHEIRLLIEGPYSQRQAQERYNDLRNLLVSAVEPVPSLVAAVGELNRTVGLLHKRRHQRATTLPITIYLSDLAPHADVQDAVEALLATAGLVVLDREDPVTGSWFRRMRATLTRTARSQAAREGALTAAHIADTRLVLAQDATITATMMQNVGPLITSLQPTKDAVVRIGAVLIVKVDWEVRVLQLTAAQQAILDHRPQLATSPRDVIGAIGLLGTSGSRTAADSAARTAADR
ncbi:hypothetical protein AB0E08_49055 [Streptomyces sp. NPDC048281]|uniref:hypothetical protein n=1 Tax=Streptomyces sp. NPDC048281 TaxID=3154715 RepID=UPI0034339AAE